MVKMVGLNPAFSQIQTHYFNHLHLKSKDMGGQRIKKCDWPCLMGYSHICLSTEVYLCWYLQHNQVGQ